MEKSQLDLNGMYYFTQVVKQNGFTAAGETLGIPKSRLSRYISQLETQLGVRLLQRSTRGIQITDIGLEFYHHCTMMMEQIDAAQLAVNRILVEPSGIVRCSVSPILADEIISKVLPAFMELYPKVNVHLQSTTRKVDLLEERIDVVIRAIGSPAEPSTLVQRSLGITRWVLAASPDYLDRHGTPQDISELKNRHCLLYQVASDSTLWNLYGPSSELKTIAVEVRLHSDNLNILRRAALSGQGIVGLPLYACQDEISSNSLKIVLPEWHPKTGELAILYPSRRGVVPAVRVFIDYLHETIPPLLNGVIKMANQSNT
ncbi:LysR substrate-binding domain-containing protein [Pseudomonas chlororaphis]|uniref:LysR substrate-binding domain-containing protein n=1 Tax=Pseudomonas chlororaphis TaxID=587753 RepID=UPI0024085788|nr:LysR substrate-binding domain-containing protein [Pseudomonas chlororaphis]